MPENKAAECDPIDYLIDSLWAALPEETADNIADFKKGVLTRIKDGVDGLIDDAIKNIDRHLENARRMRAEDDPAATAEDAAPNPA